MSNTAMTLFADGGLLALPLKGKFNLSESLITDGGHNRIGLKGARFRLIVKGKEVAVRDEPYLDAMIVGINPKVQRTFYKGKYVPGSKESPTCFSLDGETPDAKSKEAQCATCQACPQNVKGSKMTEDGKKSIACSFSQRLVVTLPGDKDKTLYEFSANSISLFGDGLPDQRKFPLKAYAKFLKGVGADLGDIVHRISFDMDSSVPKVFFSPSRNLTADEAKLALSLVGSDEVKEILSGDLDFSKETDAAAPAVEQFESQPKVEAKPEPVAEQPKTRSRPAAPKPVEEPKVEVIEEDDDDLASIIGEFE